jgi:hypothetical protein
MTRIAGIIAAAGLLMAGGVRAQDTKSETKTEHEADAKGSSTTVEKSSKDHGASSDEKTTVEHKKKMGGGTETKKESKHSTKARGGKTHKAEMKEKTVRDAQGNVIEQEKTAK